jgi:hypothetical protein
MTIESGDFRARMVVLLRLEGAVLTERELSRLAESYTRCGGAARWDVRAYAHPAHPGAREYRVLRGDGIQDVYAGIERDTATAVGTALNELESQDGTRAAPKPR